MDKAINTLAVDSAGILLAHMMQKITEYQKRLEQIPHYGGLEETIRPQLEALSSRLITAEAIVGSTAELNHLEDRLHAISRLFEAIPVDIECFSANFQLEIEQGERDRQVIKEQYESIDELEKVKLLSDMKIKELEMRVASLEAKQDKGELVWITQFTDLLKMAQRTGIAVAHSLYFQTGSAGKVGYQMQVILFMTCDRIDRNGPYITLGIQIKKGQYDALLPWPFQQKVSYQFSSCPRDVQHQSRAIKREFQPDPARPEFRRPLERSDGNNMYVWGREKVYIRDILSLVSNGQLVIKVMVDNAVTSII